MLWAYRAQSACANAALKGDLQWLRDQAKGSEVMRQPYVVDAYSLHKSLQCHSHLIEPNWRSQICHPT
jgi:hypothetical protein